MKSLLQRILNVGLVVFSVLATAEIVSAAWFSLANRHFFYLRRAMPSASPTPLEVKTALLHPLFGYILQSGASFDYQGRTLNSNNHGFQSKFDYPYVPSGNDFVIGLLGGSVASGLGFSEQFTGVIKNRLEVTSALRGRHVVVMNLATAGYKQPEQISVLGYYLAAGQKFDAVVNLDGVNELVSGYRNLERNIALAMPPIDVLGAMYSALDKGSSRSASAVAAAYHAQQQATEMEAAEHCLLAICYAWHRFQADWHAGRRNAAEAAAVVNPDATSSFKLYSDDNPRRDTKARFHALADLWERSSVVLNGMAHAAGAAYVHVLQPDQYYRTERKYSADEEKIAFGMEAGGSYTKVPLETGYPLLVAKVAKLRQDGVAAFDATQIYDAEPGPIYVDSCCHVNENGNLILGRFVADSIIATMSEAKPLPLR